MFAPSDLSVREFRPEDASQVSNLVRHVSSLEESSELRRQIKAMFLHPGFWVGCGVVICVVGIALESVAHGGLETH